MTIVRTPLERKPDVAAIRAVDIQKPSGKRNQKDSVFRMLFRRKSDLLSLFNAVNGTKYKNEEELQVNVLENAVYMNMKNDLSCVMDFRLNLYEHQSTVNPNMPLRDLFYVARLYERITLDMNLYSAKAIHIPEPRFVVFYNGEAAQPEKKVMCLSDLYSRKSKEPELELMVIQLNINPGFNNELKEKCPALAGYMVYVDKVRRYHKEMNMDKAVDRAVTECIREGILADFFRENRSEVVQMSIFEYDEEKHMRMVHEEGREEGWREGHHEAFVRINLLNFKLAEDGRTEDLIRSTQDEQYQKELLEEYEI